ncbi:Vacuolar protein sorting-associated protein 8, partial [Ascosphaera atra]
MKMFPYMSYTLTGRKYPTSEDLDETDAIKGKSEIYGFLFSGDDDQQIRFARLRTMLEFDTASFMSMLNEAFEDSFLNDDADQAQSVSRFGSKASVNRQYIISVLLEVLGPDSGFDEFSAIYLDMFIARNLPKYPQYMLLPGSALDNVLLRLCAYPIEDMLEDCQLSAECLLSMYHPPDIQGFIPALRKAKFFRILKYIYRMEEQYPNLVLTYFDDPEDQESVLTCIRNCMRKNSPLSARQRHEVSEIMETHAAELMSLNIEETAYLVQDVAEELHEKFVQALELDEGAQYYYLQVLLQPVGRRSKAQATLPESLIQLYVYRMCTYDPQHVAEFIDEVSDRRQGLHLEI